MKPYLQRLCDANGGRHRIIAVLLFIAVMVVYWQTVNSSFVSYDDLDYVVENRHIISGFTSKSVYWAFSTFYAANWHPLTWLSHMLDVELFGISPAGHHLTNIILHTINTLLIFSLLRTLTGAIWRSAIVAALFAFHPLHVESVAWVSERKDLLSAMFGILTLQLYTRYAKNPELRRYLFVVICFLLGLMAKPMLVSLPIVMLILDFWPLGRFHAFSSFIKLLKEKIPLFLLSAVSCLITIYAQQKGGAVSSLESTPLFDRLCNAALAYVGYLSKMFVPVDLAVFYPFPDKFPVWETSICAVLLSLVTYAVIRESNRRPYLLAGWLWYLVTLLPVIGIVQVGMQAMADRYTYIPLTGIFVMIVWGIADFADIRGYGKPLLSAAAMLILLILSILTSRQLSYWKDSITLFTHASKVTKGNYLALVHIAGFHKKEGRINEAIAAYKEAIAVNPGYLPAYTNLGITYAQLNDLAGAEQILGKALKIKPDAPLLHYNLGLLLYMMGRNEEAIKHYFIALENSPADENIHNNLGIALADQGRLDDAVSHFQKALEIVPDFESARENLKVAISRRASAYMR